MRILDTKDYAAMARTSEATVRYWVHTGYAAPSAKLGRRRVWREEDVIAWLEAKFSEQPTPAA